MRNSFSRPLPKRPQDSLDALRKASGTSYYKGDGSLWVKVVSTGNAGGGGAGRGAATTLEVSK